MTKEDLQKLKKLMPPKYRADLATKFDVSPPYIDKIFQGNASRADVIAEAIEMAEKHKQFLESLNNKIRNL